MTGDRDDTQEWIEAERIKRVKARFCRLVEAKQWEELGGLLTDTVEFRIAFTEESRATVPVSGTRDYFVARVRGAVGTAVMTTIAHLPEIDLLDASTARGIWTATVLSVHPHDPGRRYLGIGQFEEQYVKGADGQWRIAVLYLTYRQVYTMPPDRVLAAIGHGDGRPATLS